MGVRKISEPAQIPVPGQKQIREYFGRVSTGTGQFSVAHMIAPPGWEEPYQTPEFDEITIVVRGRLQVEHSGGTEVVIPGEVLFVERGERVRYSNPFSENAEYWAICMPAFSPEGANREHTPSER